MQMDKPSSGDTDKEDRSEPSARPSRPAVQRVLSSWSEMSSYRVRVTKRIGHVFRLPVISSHWKALARTMAPGLRVLDVGAGRRKYEKRLKAEFPGLVYESYDVDEGLPHDYYDLEEARGPYDRVLLIEVLEHLPLGEGLELLAHARELLAEGGRLYVVVPNTFSPATCLWDVTHRTHYSFAELGGLLLALGFEFPELYRVHHAGLGKRMLRTLLGPVLRLLRVDPATHIVAVAEKPA